MFTSLSAALALLAKPRALVILTLSALFSGTEAAFMSLPEGTPLKGAALKAVKRFESTLISLVVGNNAVNIGGGMLLGGWAVQELGAEDAQIFSIVFTISIMVFGEIIPKALGAAQSLRVVKATSPALLALNWVLTPVIAVLGCLTRWLPQSPTPKAEVELVSAARLLDETPVSDIMRLKAREHNYLASNQRHFSAIQADVLGHTAIQALRVRGQDITREVDTDIVVVSPVNSQVAVGYLSDAEVVAWLFDHYGE